MVRFYIVPDMLSNAPMWVIPVISQLKEVMTCVWTHRFKRVGAGAMKGRGIGTARGRATIQRAQSTSSPFDHYTAYDLIRPTWNWTRSTKRSWRTTNKAVEGLSIGKWATLCDVSSFYQKLQALPKLRLLWLCIFNPCLDARTLGGSDVRLAKLTTPHCLDKLVVWSCKAVDAHSSRPTS